jgi:hypothetical protein
VKDSFLRILWMFVGLILPLAGVGIYFAKLGLWNRLLLVFKAGSGYVTGSGMLPWLPPPFGFPIFWMSVSNTALLILGLMGTYRCARHAFPLRNADALTNSMLVLWLLVSFMEAGLRRGGWEHYALLAIPPLTVMAAYEISVAYERWKNTRPTRQALIRMLSMSALVILNFVAMDYSFYSHYISYKLGVISRQDFILGYPGTTGTGPAAWYAEMIGQYIQAHTNPDDLIYLATNNVQSYYYADRKPPVDVLWPEYLFAFASPQQIFDPRTKYIVLDKPENLDHPQWLMDGLHHDYHLETVIGGQEIYRRNPT